jgi:MoaA/NifB/PqqE/SkfB family radical SAM enzyme
MWKQPKNRISLETAKQALDFLAENGFVASYFTGGEPTLHPDLVEIVRYANRLGFFTSMTTNGTSAHKVVKELKSAGLNMLSVSLDHWDDAICEKIRGFKNIKSRQEATIRFAKEIGLSVYALAFLNPILVRDGVEHLVEYVNRELKVPFGFCYPTTCDLNSYRLGGIISDEMINANPQRAVETILEMKKKGYSIANPYQYIKEAVRFGKNEPPEHYCKGGEHVVYIDWRTNVYPCFIKPKLFNIAAGDKAQFQKNVKCNDCLINCFREPSLLPQILTSPLMALQEIRYSRNGTLKLVL